MQPRHTLHSAIASLPNLSRGTRTHVSGSISITERLFNQASLVLYPGGTLNQLSYDGFGRLAQLKYKSLDLLNQKINGEFRWTILMKN